MNKPPRFPQAKPSLPPVQEQVRKQNQSHLRAVQTNAAMSAQKPSQPAAPTVYRPQPAPQVLQRKGATPRPASMPPASNVHHPQTTRQVLQAKAAVSRQPQGAQSVAKPVAPPAYRPQPTPRVLQAKTAAGQQQPDSGHASASRLTSSIYRPQQNKTMQQKTASHERKSITGQTKDLPGAFSLQAKLKTPLGSFRSNTIQRIVMHNGAPPAFVVDPQSVLNYALGQVGQTYVGLANPATGVIYLAPGSPNVGNIAFNHPRGGTSTDTMVGLATPNQGVHLTAAIWLDKFNERKDFLGFSLTKNAAGFTPTFRSGFNTSNMDWTGSGVADDAQRILPVGWSTAIQLALTAALPAAVPPAPPPTNCVIV